MGFRIHTSLEITHRGDQLFVPNGWEKTGKSFCWPSLTLRTEKSIHESRGHLTYAATPRILHQKLTKDIHTGIATWTNLRTSETFWNLTERD